MKVLARSEILPILEFEVVLRPRSPVRNAQIFVSSSKSTSVSQIAQSVERWPSMHTVPGWNNLRSCHRE